MAVETPEDLLRNYIRILDSLEASDRAYSESCTFACGASIYVSKDIPQAERRRMVNSFLGRHNRCASHEAGI